VRHKTFTQSHIVYFAEDRRVLGEFASKTLYRSFVSGQPTEGLPSPPWRIPFPNPGSTCVRNVRTHTHTHTHRFNGDFPIEPGLPGYHDSLSALIPNPHLCCLSGRTKTFYTLFSIILRLSNYLRDRLAMVMLRLMFVCL